METSKNASKFFLWLRPCAHVGTFDLCNEGKIENTDFALYCIVAIQPICSRTEQI